MHQRARKEEILKAQTMHKDAQPDSLSNPASQAWRQAIVVNKIRTVSQPDSLTNPAQMTHIQHRCRKITEEKNIVPASDRRIQARKTHALLHAHWCAHLIKESHLKQVCWPLPANFNAKFLDRFHVRPEIAWIQSLHNALVRLQDSKAHFGPKHSHLAHRTVQHKHWDRL